MGFVVVPRFLCLLQRSRRGGKEEEEEQEEDDDSKEKKIIQPTRKKFSRIFRISFEARKGRKRVVCRAYLRIVCILRLLLRFCAATISLNRPLLSIAVVVVAVMMMDLSC